MSYDPGAWQRIGEAVRERSAEFSVDSQAAFGRIVGASRPTLRRFWTGEPGPVPWESTKIAVCRALGWTPDSIDRIVAGLSPVLADVSPPDDVTAQIEALKRLAVATGLAMEALLRDDIAALDPDLATELSEAISAVQ